MINLDRQLELRFERFEGDLSRDKSGLKFLIKQMKEDIKGLMTDAYIQGEMTEANR